MHANSTRFRAGRAAPVLGVLAWLVALAGPAAAEDLVSGGSWLAIGALAGTTQLDPAFDDYQWDTRPRMAWGVEALAGRGPLGAGLRVWRTRSSQVVDPSGSPSAAVHTTSLDLVAQGRFATLWSTDLLAVAHVGRLFFGYDPDQIWIDAGGTPIAVDLEPMQEWSAGGGLAMRRPLHRNWSAGLELDHRFFQLDTAHRNGNQVEVRRETFGDWSARLGLSWLTGRR